jgi:hypothetical protein
MAKNKENNTMAKNKEDNTMAKNKGNLVQRGKIKVFYHISTNKPMFG